MAARDQKWVESFCQLIGALALLSGLAWVWFYFAHHLSIAWFIVVYVGSVMIQTGVVGAWKAFKARRAAQRAAQEPFARLVAMMSPFGTRPAPPGYPQWHRPANTRSDASDSLGRALEEIRSDVPKDGRIIPPSIDPRIDPRKGL
jgi:hypothetical protein